MCGFVAVLTKDPDFQLRELVHMRDQLQHRGPDDAGAWIGEAGKWRVALGHRRLSIIDLSAAGAQPMHAAEDAATIVYNGEIYNYIELRQDLESKGHTFRSDSDTEVLLNAYLEWGEDCLLHLNGMFAFALFDRRTNHVFVARDRLGEKPLYWTRLSDGTTIFASEMKAIQAHSDFSARPNESTLDDFIGGRYHHSSRSTLIDRIERVKAAEAMVFTCEGERVRKWLYWQPDFAPEHDGLTFEAASEKLVELLTRSVNMRLRSDAKVGVCLSGGIDSSVIASLMDRREGTDNLSTFSICFDDDKTISENNYIDYMSQRLSFKRQEVSPSYPDMIEHFSRLHDVLEEPCLSGSILNEFLLMQLAQSDGTKVILNGQGADELLAGYQYYFQLHQLDLLNAGEDDMLEAETCLLHARLGRTARQYENASRRFNKTPGYGLDYLWARRQKGTDVGELPKIEGVPDYREHGHLRRQMALGLLHDQLPPNLHISDRCGMAFGIETRFPFLDYELVDWCTRLPNSFLIQNGWMKYILRSAMKNIVPQAVRWRVDKVGFAAPQDEWIRKAPRDWVEGLLFSDVLLNRDGYDRAKFESMLSSHLSGTGSDHSWELWKWMSISQWLQGLGTVSKPSRESVLA